jgi:Zn-finger nucleic acid-binding protein
MKCPKCHGEFEKVSLSSIEVDRCENCRGLWFDMLEKEDLVKIKGSESIDIGNEQAGARYREMRDIDCPSCGVAMIPMIDKDQFHIKYESCPSCYGTFFDAGEFKDLKEFTVLERFGQLLKTLRSNL